MPFPGNCISPLPLCVLPFLALLLCVPPLPIPGLDLGVFLELGYLNSPCTASLSI